MTTDQDYSRTQDEAIKARARAWPELTEHMEVMARLRQLKPQVEDAAELIAKAMQAGGKLLICGNGGSAADAQHIAAEFVGRFSVDRAPLPALALTTDTSALTAIANDFDFNAVFSRQVLALGRPGDVLLAISTSGNSANVLRAVIAARMQDIATIGLLGCDGGLVAEHCDAALLVPSTNTARIQEAHIFLAHSLVGMVERLLEPNVKTLA